MLFRSSGRVRGVFHRQRGGAPTASSTRRRACTGGQRQSYKRAGYLTSSPGLASRGLVGIATAPRSSSWRGQRCFLEGKTRRLRPLGYRVWASNPPTPGRRALRTLVSQEQMGPSQPLGQLLPLLHQASWASATQGRSPHRPHQHRLISRGSGNRRSWLYTPLGWDRHTQGSLVCSRDS